MNFSFLDFLSCGTIMSTEKGRILMGWGKSFARSATDLDPKLPAFYISDFFLKTPNPWIQYEHWMDCSIEDCQNRLGSSITLSACDWAIQNPEQFRTAFKALGVDLKNGQLKKAVPYLFAHSLSIMTKDRLHSCLLRALSWLDQNPCYLYGHWNNERGVLGISPELLFTHTQSDAKKLHTMALAGTCHSSVSSQIFLTNEKEQHEHRLVVQGICQSLQGVGSVTVKPLQLLRLPRLTHMMTPIEVALDHSFCFDTFVHRLHPTPALGAVPAGPGLKWLEAYEKHTSRELYGIPIGVIDPGIGLSQCIIGIRNVQWNQSGMRIGAGCGVVKDSYFEKEWQEIQFKIRAIRDQLNI